LVLAAQRVEPADWPQWLGPTRDGVSSEAVAPWRGRPKVVWRRKVSKAFSSIVSDGIVFVHASDDDKNIEDVIALDAQTGKTRWRDSYPRAKYRSQLGAGPRATPSVTARPPQNLSNVGRPIRLVDPAAKPIREIL
jgi:outer membrane protein assembly factor BamB